MASRWRQRAEMEGGAPFLSFHFRTADAPAPGDAFCLKVNLYAVLRLNFLDVIGDLNHVGIGAIAVAGEEDFVTGFGAFQRGDEEHHGICRPCVIHFAEERVQHLLRAKPSLRAISWWRRAFGP